MPQTTALPHVSLSPDRGVCAQDFETSISQYVRAQHLRGLLNFSALWNHVTYIYDTAVGDNPHLLKSQWARPGSDERALYATFREFVEAGIVRCLVRDKVSVDGSNLTSDPTISELYSGWRRRDGQNTTNFMTQEFGRKRELYNQHIDRLLFEDNLGAIERYDPDVAKPKFRSIVREELTSRGVLWELVGKLPADLRYEYERTCAEKEFMTTVDLWGLVSGFADRSNPAKDLLLMQGYVNQQAIADSIAANVVGSDCGPWRPGLRDQQSAAARTPADILDQADLKLTGPPIELLALLSTSDVLALRKVRTETLGKLSLPRDADIDLVRRTTAAAMEAYWAGVCEFLDKNYPQRTRAKTDILGFFDPAARVIQAVTRRFPWMPDAVSVVVRFAVAVEGFPGAGVFIEPVKRTLRYVTYRFVYKPTPEFRALRGLESALWKPKDVWANLTRKAERDKE